MKIKRIWCAVTSFLALSASIEAEVVVSRCEIRLGMGTDKIGVTEDEWKPLFFGIDADGEIYIPDFVQGRIAVFSADGEYIRQIQGVDGLSPRLNYFNRAPDGSFILFSDSTLFRITDDGTTAWNAPFPLGAIPRHIQCGTKSVFVFLAGQNGDDTVLEIPYETAVEARVLDPAANGAMRTLERAFINGETESPSRNATFLDEYENGLSVWISTETDDPIAYLVRKGEASTDEIILNEIAEFTSAWRQFKATRQGNVLRVYCYSLYDDRIVIASMPLSPR